MKRWRTQKLVILKRDNSSIDKEDTPGWFLVWEWLTLLFWKVGCLMFLSFLLVPAPLPKLPASEENPPTSCPPPLPPFGIRWVAKDHVTVASALALCWAAWVVLWRRLCCMPGVSAAGSAAGKSFVGSISRCLCNSGSRSLPYSFILPLCTHCVGLSIRTADQLM